MTWDVITLLEAFELDPAESDELIRRFFDARMLRYGWECKLIGVVGRDVRHDEIPFMTWLHRWLASDVETCTKIFKVLGAYWLAGEWSEVVDIQRSVTESYGYELPRIIMRGNPGFDRLAIHIWYPEDDFRVRTYAHRMRSILGIEGAA